MRTEKLVECLNLRFLDGQLNGESNNTSNVKNEVDCDCVSLLYLYTDNTK